MKVEDNIYNIAMVLFIYLNDNSFLEFSIKNIFCNYVKMYASTYQTIKIILTC